MTSDLAFFYHPHTYEMRPSAQLGLGMLMLATHAKSLGASVEVINAQAMSMGDALENIPRARFLCLYGCLVDAPIINEVGAYALDNKLVGSVIVGGPIARSPEKLSCESVETVVVGDGEEFIARVLGGFPIPVSLANGIRVYEAPKVEDINDYPFPDRSLIRGETGGDIFVSGSGGEQSTTILMSRWCRNRCAFCSSGYSRTPVQDYNLERIEAEIDHCVDLGLHDIRISDDNILNDEDRLYWICELLRTRWIRWRASLRVKPSSEETYRMMVNSGCEELSFGIESGDQAVLNRLRKGIKVQQNTAAVRNAKAAGVKVVRALMMMSTPGETQETLALNMDWVREANPDIVSLKVFVPYPGTDIYERPDHYGCKLVSRGDYNNSSYRPDGSTPRSNIELPGVMTQDELTTNLMIMRRWVEKKGKENRG